MNAQGMGDHLLRATTSHFIKVNAFRVCRKEMGCTGSALNEHGDIELRIRCYDTH